MQVVAKNIESAVFEYGQFLKNIDFSKKPKDITSKILELLIYRDLLQTLWSDEFTNQSLDIDREKFITLSHRMDDLDKILKSNRKFIIKAVDLEKWREKLKPDKSSWWWFFKEEVDKSSIFYRFDWLWNVSTAVTLAISASFMINIYSAISMGDATFATALSTIAQIMGLAVIGGGALSSKGQKVVKNFLTNMNIPSKFFAEATFLIGFLLMSSVYYINSNLDEYFYNNGTESYNNGELSNSIQYLLQAKTINPNGSKYDSKLGASYESLGNLPKASQFYLQSIENGNFEDLNSLGRVFINQLNPITRTTNPLMAESYLLLALQRLQTYKNAEKLMYQVRTNMGWVLLEQKKYERAKGYLEEAIKRYENSKELQGIEQNNMAYCFLAQVNDEQNNTQEASKLWIQCINKANPEFIHQYNWFIKNKKEKIAYCVNTKNVVTGFNKERNEFSKTFCETVKNEIKSKI